MANMRNKWEFYGSILEALGVDYTDAELKNNETLRAKLLEGLGVEHTYDDVNQYPLWREKLVEGIGNMSGGSVTWNTVYSDTIDPEGEVPPFSVDIPLTLTGSDKIKVTFNGTEYECEKKENQGGKPYYGADSSDFLTYPFSLTVDPVVGTVLTTSEAGTYSLKIEEPQSGGGSSDFSMANVTITNNRGEESQMFNAFACYNENEIDEGSPSMTFNRIIIPYGETVVLKVPLYKGIAYWNGPFKSLGPEATVTGSILNESGNFAITGDGTITI